MVISTHQKWSLSGHSFWASCFRPPIFRHPVNYSLRERPAFFVTSPKVVVKQLLEPRSIEPNDDGSNPEYIDMRKRFILGAVLTIPLVIITMREMIHEAGKSRSVLSGLPGFEMTQYKWLKRMPPYIPQPEAQWHQS